MLRVHGSHGAPGLRTPDRAAATAARPTAGTIICLSHVVPLPPRAGNEYRIHRMLVRLRKSGYRIVLVVSPLAPQTIEDARWDELAATYGNVVHCERDGHVRVRLDECPDVLTAMDGHRTRHYAALLDEIHPMSPAAAEMLHIDRSFCHDALIATLLQLQTSLEPCAVLAEYVWMTRGLPLLDPGVLTIIDTHRRLLDVSGEGGRLRRLGLGSVAGGGIPAAGAREGPSGHPARRSQNPPAWRPIARC